MLKMSALRWLRQVGKIISVCSIAFFASEYSAKTTVLIDGDHPPIGRRFILMVLFVGGGIFFALNAPDDERRLLGAACVCAGLFLVVIGFGLWWVTGFPFTWGWLL